MGKVRGTAATEGNSTRGTARKNIPYHAANSGTPG